MERVTQDIQYKNKHEENELNEAKDLFDGERRKSMGIEQAAAHLQKEHKHLTEEVDILRKEVRETEAIIKELASKYN
jgi:polyhydroxyalkanoate synthesis regulator phasin